ncbi:hypothetical protein [Streptomyces sp.]|uniref:hypothetical protein n=1 Tax=Streptomyces sp. TaxID=1931 RepID=UPI002F92EA54
MISEPELVGGEDFPVAEPLRPPEEPRAPRQPRPWLWALGGVVVASAVWGGGLYAYERYQDRGPDLGGYGHAGELCRKAELKALGVVLGTRSQDGAQEPVKHRAVDQASCALSYGPPESGYSVSVTYTLHKVVDPGPEFAARTQLLEEAEPVDGLGEEAYFRREGDQGATLSVLDGQAELDITLYSQFSWNETTGKTIEQTKPIDLSGIEVPLTQDMRALMAALKK